MSWLLGVKIDVKKAKKILRGKKKLLPLQSRFERAGLFCGLFVPRVVRRETCKRVKLIEKTERKVQASTEIL